MGKMKDAHDIVERKLKDIHENFPEYFKETDLRVLDVNNSKFFHGQLTYGELKIVLEALKKGLES